MHSGLALSADISKYILHSSFWQFFRTLTLRFRYSSKRPYAWSTTSTWSTCWRCSPTWWRRCSSSCLPTAPLGYCYCPSFRLCSSRRAHSFSGSDPSTRRSGLGNIALRIMFFMFWPVIFKG